MLAEHFCRMFAKELGKQITHMSAEAAQLLMKYHWPGNVRELQSVIKHAILEATGPVLVPAFLPDMIYATAPAHQNAEDSHSAAPVAAQSAPDAVMLSPHNHDDRTTDWDVVVARLLESRSESIYDETLPIMERSVICRVLRHTQGNQLQAARLRGLSHARLRVKCRWLGITMETVVGEG